MSVCQIQVNSPITVEGVNLLPGTYNGEEHRPSTANDVDGERVTYTLQLPVESSGDGTIGSVQTLDVTALVKSGALMAFL